MSFFSVHLGRPAESARVELGVGAGTGHPAVEVHVPVDKALFLAGLGVREELVGLVLNLLFEAFADLVRNGRRSP